MRTLFLSILIFISFCFILNGADAARFGGGRSFGSSGYSRSVSPNYSSPVKTASPSRWLGPLAGLAIGGLLATLFMGHGFGSGIFTWLILGGVIFLIWKFIKSKGLQSQAFANKQQEPGGNVFNFPFSQSQNQADFQQQATKNEAPIGFDEAAFLRKAKTIFMRLQSAYDSKNLADIREFTSPEVFAEIQMQFQERGDAVNVTEVIAINAELVDVAQDNSTLYTSVLFSGKIREQAGAEPTSVNETWHFRKSPAAEWMVTGIQQQ